MGNSNVTSADHALRARFFSGFFLVQDRTSLQTFAGAFERA